MKVLRLDHANVVTARLAEMIAWYGDILDMHPGDRPPFDIGGAWLYADGYPIVHLVEVSESRKSIEPNIEHFAVTATGMPEFIAKLKDRGIEYRLGWVPERPVVQETRPQWWFPPPA